MGNGEEPLDEPQPAAQVRRQLALEGNRGPPVATCMTTTSCGQVLRLGTVRASGQYRVVMWTNYRCDELLTSTRGCPDATQGAGD